MSADLDLEEIFPQLAALLRKDVKCAAVPFLTQIAADFEDAEQVRAYNKEFEAALGNGAPIDDTTPSGPGVLFSAVVAESDTASESRGTLDLENLVVLAVVENVLKNTTGLTGYQYTRRALRLLQNQSASFRGARKEIRLSKPAFNLGPTKRGLVVHFINLLVRTTEPLGAIEPV